MGGILFGHYYLDEIKPQAPFRSQTEEKIISPSQIPSPMPALSIRPTEKPNVKKTIPASTIDLDPVVDCNIHSNCGGGTKKLFRSACDASICCQINNKWVFYPSKSLCQQHQSEWAEYYKAEALLESGYFSNWADESIQQYKADMAAIVNNLRDKNQKILDEAESFKVDIPETDYSLEELEKAKQYSIVIEPTSKPKCPPTYFTGGVNVGGGLPCEP